METNFLSATWKRYLNSVCSGVQKKDLSAAQKGQSVESPLVASLGLQTLDAE